MTNLGIKIWSTGQIIGFAVAGIALLVIILIAIALFIMWIIEKYKAKKTKQD